MSNDGAEGTNLDTHDIAVKLRKTTDEQLVERLTATQNAVEKSSPNTVGSMENSVVQIWKEIAKVVYAHNMRFSDCVDLLNIVAPLCDKLTPDRAKNFLEGLVEFVCR